MVISIQWENQSLGSRQASGRERRTRAKWTVVISKRSLFLAALIVVLAALLAVQASGVGTGANVAPGQVQAADASTAENAPVGDQFPSVQAWVDTSPYAHDPISITGGAPGINMPQ
jgi:hypothetical protein